MTQTLLPCPFCGGDAEVDKQRGYLTMPNGRLDHAVAVYCVACSAEICLCYADHRGRSTEDLAAEVTRLWNARPSPTEPAETVDAELREVWIDGCAGALRAHGKIYHDKKQRFADGDHVCTSVILRRVAADIIETKNTRYRLIGPVVGSPLPTLRPPLVERGTEAISRTVLAPLWRHVKRGSTYTEIARGPLQASTRPAVEGDTIVAYRGKDGRVFFREQGEFEDGRFERVEAE